MIRPIKLSPGWACARIRRSSAVADWRRRARTSTAPPAVRFAWPRIAVRLTGTGNLALRIIAGTVRKQCHIFSADFVECFPWNISTAEQVESTTLLGCLFVNGSKSSLVLPGSNSFLWSEWGTRNAKCFTRNSIMLLARGGRCKGRWGLGSVGLYCECEDKNVREDLRMKCSAWNIFLLTQLPWY